MKTTSRSPDSMVNSRFSSKRVKLLENEYIVGIKRDLEVLMNQNNYNRPCTTKGSHKAKLSKMIERTFADRISYTSTPKQHKRISDISTSNKNNSSNEFRKRSTLGELKLRSQLSGMDSLKRRQKIEKKQVADNVVYAVKPATKLKVASAKHSPIIGAETQVVE